jgi:membrane protein required for colicin V production
MLYYDLGMLGILLFTLMRGAARGIAWQLAAIAAMVLCFLFATPFSSVVEPVIRNHVEPPLSRYVAMLVVYLACSFGCFAVATMFRGFLEAIRFDAYDRHLGAMFGLIKGVILCFSITFFAVCLTSGPLQAALLNTNSGYISAVIMAKLIPILPPEIEKLLRPFSQTLEHKGNDILREQGNAEDDGEDSLGRAGPSFIE